MMIVVPIITKIICPECNWHKTWVEWRTGLLPDVDGIISFVTRTLIKLRYNSCPRCKNKNLQWVRKWDGT